jgi:hypothetical protein
VVIRPVIVTPAFRIWLAVAVVAAGCGGGGGSDLMPLEVGQTRLYKVQAGFESYVTTMKVSREISVANTVGYELTSTLGVSRLAWSDGALVAERLVTTQFMPPLPLLFKAEETHDRIWKGRIVFVDKAAPAMKDYAAGKKLVTATQSQSVDDQIPFRGNKIHCIRSTVNMQTAENKIEITTWFSAGLGIVRQEQRTDGALVLKLDLLDESAK